jgi:hypothetical protein
MKNTDFWDVIYVYVSFGGKFCFHLKGRRVKLFYPEDGGRNVLLCPEDKGIIFP